jgi:hypothetical protein
VISSVLQFLDIIGCNAMLLQNFQGLVMGDDLLFVVFLLQTKMSEEGRKEASQQERKKRS